MTLKGYFDPMEAYWQNYHMAKYGLKKEGYSIREVPFTTYLNRPENAQNSTKSMADSFICDIVKDSKELDADDIFKSKSDLAHSRISLLLDIVDQLENTKYNSLKYIYRDIFSLQKEQTELPFPLNYDFSSTLKLKEDRLGLYREARQIMENNTKHLSFIGKDLVESLLAYKNLKTKETLFADDLTGEK